MLVTWILPKGRKLGTTDGGEEKNKLTKSSTKKTWILHVPNNFVVIQAEQVQNDNSRTVLLDCESSIHSHNFYLRPFKKTS